MQVIIYGKAAVDCTPDEIAAECWAQVKAGRNSPGDTQLSDGMLVDWFLDPALVFSGGPVVSTEPLLINTPGALAQRPEATTSIPNLFLASDYVRCDVDLATMEGANEAARAARSEEHTSELQSLMRLSYAVFCLKQKNT